jgi:hypothetical protein
MRDAWTYSLHFSTKTIISGSNKQISLLTLNVRVYCPTTRDIETLYLISNNMVR